MTGEKLRRGNGLPLLVGLSILVSSALLISAFSAMSIYDIRTDRLYNEEVWNNVLMLADSTCPQLVNSMTVGDHDSVVAIMSASLSGSELVDDAMALKEDGTVYYDADGAREGKRFSEKMLKPGLAYLRRPIILRVGLAYGSTISEEKRGELILGVARKDLFRNERVGAVAAFARNVSESISVSVSNGDYLGVREMIGNMRETGGGNIIYTELLQTDGTIVFYSEQGMSDEKAKEMEGKLEKSRVGKLALETTPRKPLKIQSITTVRGIRAMDISVPVLRDGKKIAVLRVGYSLEDFLAGQARSRMIFACSALTFALLGICASILLSLRISTPIRRLSNAAERVGEGDLNTRVDIRSGGRETRMLGEAFNSMVGGLKERDFIKDTFSRYVTKQVAEEILKDTGSISLGGRKQEVTILFSDIRGFTTFSERNTPEDVIQHLNEYFSAMVDSIFKYEGTLDKFIGDAVMAVFGSPVAHEDDPLRAVSTALDMRERLEALNAEWTAAGRDTLRIGIGINTGEAIVGNIGDIRRMEYTVIGDNVNLASRLESLTKEYECPIIISESTMIKLTGRIDSHLLGEVTVKGKTQPVRIYELKGLL